MSMHFVNLYPVPNSANCFTRMKNSVVNHTSNKTFCGTNVGFLNALGNVQPLPTSFALTVWHPLLNTRYNTIEKESHCGDQRIVIVLYVSTRYAVVHYFTFDVCHTVPFSWCLLKSTTGANRRRSCQAASSVTRDSPRSGLTQVKTYCSEKPYRRIFSLVSGKVVGASSPSVNSPDLCSALAFLIDNNKENLPRSLGISLNSLSSAWSSGVSKVSMCMSYTDE